MEGKGFLEDELSALEERFLRQINRFSKLSQSGRISLALQFDFFGEMQRQGLTNIIEELQSDYGGILKNLAQYKPSGISPITYQELQTIMELDSQSLLRSAASYSAQFQSSLIKGFISGEEMDVIADRLSNIGLLRNQVISVITTARDQFFAVSTAKVFEDEPERRFRLEGVVDDRIRCACKGVMLYQPKTGYTLDQINKGAWTVLAKRGCLEFGQSRSERQYINLYLGGKYTFVNRGGYNCRHYPEPVI